MSEPSVSALLDAAAELTGWDGYAVWAPLSKLLTAIEYYIDPLGRAEEVYLAAVEVADAVLTGFQ